MRPEQPRYSPRRNPDLSHIGAFTRLIRDAVRYLPGAYLNSLKERPSTRAGLTLAAIGSGIAITGDLPTGVKVALVGVLLPPIGLIGNAVQIGWNIWNGYRRGILAEMPPADLPPKVNLF